MYCSIVHLHSAIVRMHNILMKSKHWVLKMLSGLVQTAGKSVLFLKSDFEHRLSALSVARDQIRLVASRQHHSYRPIYMSYCGKKVGVSTCAGEQLHNTEVQQLEKWNSSSRYPNTCAFKSRCRSPPHQTDPAMEQTSKHKDVPCCSHDELHCAVRGLQGWIRVVKSWLAGYAYANICWLLCVNHGRSALPIESSGGFFLCLLNQGCNFVTFVTDQTCIFHQAVWSMKSLKGKGKDTLLVTYYIQHTMKFGLCI